MFTSVEQTKALTGYDVSLDIVNQAQGIIEALNGRRRLPTRNEAQAYISENFTWAKMAERTIQVYSEALR